MSYVISCCSTADLTKEQFESRDIKYVCFHFELDGVQYLDDLGESMPFKQFYDTMVAGAMTKTSMPNVDEFVAFFQPILEQGKDILHLCLSSGISGVYNAASAAAEQLRPMFPDRKLLVLDSLCACGGLGLMMDKLADLRDAGLSIDELYAWAEKHRLEVNHWFFTTDLTFFIRGGRVSKLSGWFGTRLNICPLLNVNDKGALVARTKHRGKKKVIEAIVAAMDANVRDGADYDGKVIINQADCYDDARAVADLIEARYPKMNGKVIINSIGTTIGSHTGPGTVALFFWGSPRTA